MKILQVIPHYFPSTHFGGTPVSCHYLSLNLTKLGHGVDVLTSDAFGPKERYSPKTNPEKYSNYQIFRFRNLVNSMAYKNRFAIPIPNLIFLFFKLPSYDVIQLHEYRSLFNVLICLAKPFIKSRYILYPLGTYPIFNTQTKFKKIFDFLFARIINSSIDHYVTVSNVEKRSLIQNRVPKNKVTTIYYGIDVIESKFAQKGILPYSYILYLGRIDKRKGLDFLIEAYAQSGIYNSKIHLVIAGNDSNFLTTCKAIVKKYKLVKLVHFMKPVSGIKKATLYKNSNLVAYATDNEAYGLVPAEAAICGTSSVYSKSAGVAEVLQGYNIGESVNYGDIESLASILKKFGTHRNKVPKQKIKKLIDKYSWLSVAKNFEKIYQNG